MKNAFLAFALIAWVILANEARAFAMQFGFNIHQGITADALYPRFDGKNPAFYIDVRNGTTVTFSQDVISDIAYENAQTDFIYNAGGRQPSQLHFDDEDFYRSSLRLVNLRTEIIALMRDDVFLDFSAEAQPERELRVKKARKLLGQALHTLQDFYSHTNWVDRGIVQGNVKINSALGKATLPRPASSAQCNGNEPGFSTFTSGYWFEEDFCLAPAGKCAHGRPAPTACSPFGLNKDVPTRPNHGTAVNLAKEHTRVFVEEILLTLMGDLSSEDSRMDVAVCQFMGVANPIDTCSTFFIADRYVGEIVGRYWGIEGECQYDVGITLTLAAVGLNGANPAFRLESNALVTSVAVDTCGYFSVGGGTPGMFLTPDSSSVAPAVVNNTGAFYEAYFAIVSNFYAKIEGLFSSDFSSMDAYLYQNRVSATANVKRELRGKLNAQ